MRAAARGLAVLLVSPATIHQPGVSIPYDWAQWFVRLAFDPKVNFTSEDMWRVSVGMRF
jgi:hypothetical protein